MMGTMNNREIAQLLRKVAAAYLILNDNRFKIIAYERAADSIEHATSEVKDLWDEGKLGDIPGVGDQLKRHLDELFRTGRVKHFETVVNRLPASLYPLLLVPGIGPKKAYKLVTELKLRNEKTVIDDLAKAAKANKIASLEGFGDKSQFDILANIESYKRGQIKENRMALPEADAIAQDVMKYLTALPCVARVDALGSLRRQVSTIGDIDISVATDKPQDVIKHFVNYPHQKVIENGPTGASLLLKNGRQVDVRVQHPKAYGAMLQYFTGSKHHNIKLREYALAKGLSLSEHGIKPIRKASRITHPALQYNREKKLYECALEEDVYKAVGLPWISPEIREDKGEIEAARSHTLPHLITREDIKGDVHVHTSYNLESSHDVGEDDVIACLNQAATLGYEYIGVSDHNPSVGTHTEKQIVDIMKRRKDFYEHKYYSWVQKVSNKQKITRLFIMCEVDILSDGTLALPNPAFDFVDAVIVSVHSGFMLDKTSMTRRVVRALTAHPKVRVFGHPTARLLGKREGIELDWREIFAVCKDRHIALEINAYPQRLDLPDTIVFDARREGVAFCINTDSHAVEQMRYMNYGVSVARRGWAQKDDVVNTMEYNKFKKWLVQ